MGIEIEFGCEAIRFSDKFDGSRERPGRSACHYAHHYWMEIFVQKGKIVKIQLLFALDFNEIGDVSHLNA